MSERMDPGALNRAVRDLAARAGGPAWLAAQRATALHEFEQYGLPGTATEDWRYTNLGPVAQRIVAASSAAAGPADSSNAVRAQIPAIADGDLAVFVDGQFRSDLSRLGRVAGAAWAEAGTALTGLLAPPPQDVATADSGRGVTALKTALLRDGLVVDIAESVVLDAPLHLVFLHSRSTAAHAGVVVRLGANSIATVIEHHLGSASAVGMSTTKLACAARSRLAFVKLQTLGEAACHLGTQQLTVGAEAAVDLLHLDLGGRLARNDLTVELAGPGATVVSHGLFFADGARHLDNHTRIDHRAPRTRSLEVYRGIADDSGRGVFNGRIVVHPGANQTDARLTNQNLLLSNLAEIDTKPELEIYADDVRCSHGATTGQLDRNAVFYLRSRGIGAEEARQLLIASFAREIVRHLPPGGLEAQVIGILESRLPGLAAAGARP